MATRKKPETRYLKDSSHSVPTVLPNAELENEQFCTVIRAILKSGIEHSEVLHTVSKSILEGFGLELNGKASRRIPKQGSDQVNVGSVVTWMKKIKSTDKKAIEQLQTIRATAANRLA